MGRLIGSPANITPMARRFGCSQATPERPLAILLTGLFSPPSGNWLKRLPSPEFTFDFFHQPDIAPTTPMATTSKAMPPPIRYKLVLLAALPYPGSTPRGTDRKPASGLGLGESSMCSSDIKKLIKH